MGAGLATNRTSLAIALVAVGALAGAVSVPAGPQLGTVTSGPGPEPGAPLMVDLKADVATVLLPHGASSGDVGNDSGRPTGRVGPPLEAVEMWGFGLLSDPEVTVPGPVLVVPPGTTSLEISLTNYLPVPVSIIIPGQSATGVPVWDDGSMGSRPSPTARVRSLTHETPASTVSGCPCTETYVWANPRPGTYLYQSGTHMAVQVPMGLYGALTMDESAGVAYPASAAIDASYDDEVLLLYSEIDPVLREAVIADEYGPGKSITSTIDYRPQFFLVNGVAYTDTAHGSLDLTAGNTTLVRILNAGLRTHVPAFEGLFLDVIAEDGHLYPFARQHYSVLLPAGKTKDALVTADATAGHAVHDRTLFVSRRIYAPAEACFDGIDNDLDTLVDCADPECAGATGGACVTGDLGICSPGIRTCSAGAALCVPLNTPVAEMAFLDPVCTDSLDNDCDGKVDLFDPGCSPPPATSGLVAHWTFDEGSGPDALDSANGFDGTLAGGALWTTMGQKAGALIFDGLDDTVVIGPAFDPAPQGTVTLWVKPDPDGSNFRILGGDDAWEVLVEGDDQPSNHLFAAGLSHLDALTAIPAGSWTHLAFTYDSGTGSQEIYVDGVLDNTSGSTANDDPGSFTLTIGTRTGSTDFYRGVLDEVRIYDRVLTQVEVAALIEADLGAGDHTPVADDQAVSTDEDDPLPITLTGSDPNGDPLTFMITIPPVNGVLSGTPPNLTYTSDPDLSGLDSFTFVVDDGNGNSDTGTVSITIDPANDPPVSEDQSVLAERSVPLVITLGASDIDLDPLTYEVVTPPGLGSLGSDDGDEFLTYTPLGTIGATSFTFRAFDGLEYSVPSTVSILILSWEVVDDFNRAADTVVGNGWVEVEGPGASIVIANSE